MRFELPDMLLENILAFKKRKAAKGPVTSQLAEHDAVRMQSGTCAPSPGGNLSQLPGLSLRRAGLYGGMVAKALLLPVMLTVALQGHTQQEKPDLLSFTNMQGQTQVIRKKEDWSRKRMQLLKDMEAAMGPLPGRDGLKPPVITVLDTLRRPGYDRLNVRIRITDAETVPALLYLPHAAGRKPAMLALHGTGALGKELTDSLKAGPNRATATELANRGYVVLAPDYPGFGDLSDYDFESDRYESGTMKAIFNHIRCLDYLETRADVNRARMGVIGHSLGGHNALFAGAFDTRLKVVVSSCGWTLFPYYDAGKTVTARYGGKLGPWAQDRYMPLIREKYGLDPARMPFDFDGVIACVAPRPFFSCSPLNDANFNPEGVKQGIKNVAPVYRFLHAEKNLRVSYPDAGHDFPEETRFLAYAFIDSILKK